VGDTANGSWNSNELGGYIRREESAKNIRYTENSIAISGLEPWVFHNLLVDHGEKFSRPCNMQAAALAALDEEEERQESAEIVWLDERPGVRLTGKDLLAGFGLVLLIGVGMWLLIVESFVQSGIR